MYIDILKPPSLLSLSLQGCELDTVLGIKNILKSITALKSPARQDPFEWSTASYCWGGLRMKEVRSCTRVLHWRNSAQQLKRNWKMPFVIWPDLMRTWQNDWSGQISSCCGANSTFLRCSRGQSGPVSLSLRVVLKMRLMMTAASWGQEICKSIWPHFRLPLEAKWGLLASLQDEVEEGVEYARTYLDISHTKYHKVWYMLYSCPNAQNWFNNLSLCELSFSLPFSNCRVEQIFSALKVLKISQRTNLQGDTLNDLPEIFVEGPALS